MAKRTIVKRGGRAYIKTGNLIRRVNDKFAVKTIHGQIIPGFQTRPKARAWGNKNVEKGFKIVTAPWYLDVW